MMASPSRDGVEADETATMSKENAGISTKLVGVESELELMEISDEISISLLDASLSEYQ